MLMEIEGHEWFGADGKWIWYDLQTPRSQDFWVAGYEIATGSRTWYHLERSEWSVHFNVSPDGNFLRATAVDQTAWPRRGMVSGFICSGRNWLPDRTDGELPNAKDLIRPGVFQSRETGQSRQT